MISTSPKVVQIRSFKRIFDLFIVLVSGIVLLPIISIISISYIIIMIFKPADRGSILHKEKRYTRGNKFNLYKFRIIRQTTLSDLKNKHGNRTFVKKLEENENNLTFIGHYLKKFYLDELPQIFNIIKGDMSIVGPRPWPVAQADEEINRGVFRKFICWPGLVGPVQVTKGIHRYGVSLDSQYLERYRSFTSFQLLKLDLDYMYKGIRTIIKAKGL